MDLGLKNKVAVVAAASRGLGRAVAEALAAEGARVAICGRNAERLEATAEAIRRQTGAAVLSQVADVRHAAAVHEFVEQAVARWGTVHIGVVNAGGPPAKEFSALTVDDWDQAIHLNLLSAVHFARALLPRMRQQKWGRLLFMTSVAVKQPIEELLLSNSVRSAVTGLAKSLANECARDNVLVNTVCPGYTLTERLEELAAAQAAAKNTPPEKIYEAWQAQIPLGRLARPE
ncbi:MAG: SDR family NAD(P)-dependent oxidoreductase, partial [Acidobacteria bacterium]|nr:SDR family NAD(P)-dependent oxidoreductase [Acidobacteriota bacterium]